MRLTIFLLIMTIMQVSASTYGQQITLNKKNVPLEQVFKAIMSQTGYNVIWQPGKLKNAKPVNASFENEALEKVLDKVLSDQPFSYTIENKTIVIRDKEKTILDKL